MRRSVTKLFWGIVFLVTILTGIVYWLAVPPTGLIRTFYSETNFAGEPLVEALTSEIDLTFLERDPALPGRSFNVIWRGFWFFSRGGSVDLYAGADDRVVISVDGRPVIKRSRLVGMKTIRKTINLSAGAHEILVRYKQNGGNKNLNVKLGYDGETPSAFVPTQLFPSRPRTQDFVLVTIMYWWIRLLAVFWIVAVLYFYINILCERFGSNLKEVGRSSIQQLSVSGSQWTSKGLSSRPLIQGLHLLTLFSLAVAYPLFEVLSAEPTFFVARNTTSGDLVGLVVVICFLLPATLIGIEIILARFSAVAGDVAHGVMVTLLAWAWLMPLMKKVDFLWTAVSIVFALLIAVLFAVAYKRLISVRIFTTALSPAIIVVPILFLLNTDVRESVIETDSVYPTVSVQEGPPIVMIVFDEFPTSSLLNAKSEIDEMAYPNIASLSKTSTWYRNASTVSNHTKWAVPAIVASKYPIEPNAVPTRRYFPNNLFTMLSDSYRMTVFGRFLQLCPTNKCNYDLEVRDSLTLLLQDLSVVYLHIVSPDSLRRYLPSVVGNWLGFARKRSFRDEDGKRVRNDRQYEFGRFLETIKSNSKAELYFLHTLVPHMPYQFVPSGNRYATRRYQGYVEGGEKLFYKTDPWLPIVVQQRHLLQVGFVDRLVGRLVDRLKSQGIFKEALIIITADHGSSFIHGSGRRRFHKEEESQGVRADVLLVPLIIKFPGQVVGTISDRNVEIVDIVPTIASVLRVTVPYDVDGRSLLTESERPYKTFIRRGTTRAVVERHQRILPDRSVSLKKRLLEFRLGLYALGPSADLVGFPLSVDEFNRESETFAQIDNVVQFEDVDILSGTLPLAVRGSIEDSIDKRVSVAIAVNGTIVATTQSHVEHDQWVFVSMIPEKSLRSGKNDVRAFIVDELEEDPVLLSGIANSSRENIQ